MREKIKENFTAINPEEYRECREGSADFDRKAEKEKRKELRKILTGALSAALKEAGLKKEGNSLWGQKIGDTWRIVYLQRSQFGHKYYIEAGVCKENDIPKKEKPGIIYCKIRERIEGIVENIERERAHDEDNEDVGEKNEEKIKDIRAMLDFEEPGASEKYPGEYFVPSVSSDEAERKIKGIQNVVKEYVPLWLDEASKKSL